MGILARYFPVFKKHLESACTQYVKNLDLDNAGCYQSLPSQVVRIGLLTKFGIIDGSVILNLMKKMSEDATVEKFSLVLLIMANCGNYLFMNPDYKKRFQSILMICKNMKSGIEVTPELQGFENFAFQQVKRRRQ